MTQEKLYKTTTPLKQLTQEEIERIQQRCHEHMHKIIDNLSHYIHDGVVAEINYRKIK